MTSFTCLVLLVSATTVLSAPAVLTTSLVQTITFVVNSSETNLNTVQSVECIQHFLKQISEGQLKLDLPNLNFDSAGTVKEMHKFIVHSGTRSNGCTMIWTSTGSQQSISPLILDHHLDCDGAFLGLGSDGNGGQLSFQEEEGYNDEEKEEEDYRGGEGCDLDRKRRSPQSQISIDLDLTLDGLPDGALVDAPEDVAMPPEEPPAPEE